LSGIEFFKPVVWKNEKEVKNPKRMEGKNIAENFVELLNSPPVPLAAD
jgi:hypothetical protein